MLFRPVLFLSLAIGSLARSDFRRSPSRPAHNYRQVARQCAPRQQTGTERPSDPKTRAAQSTGGAFRKDIEYKGNDFFSQWDFFTASDPTHGLVRFQSLADAQSKHLAYVENGAAVLTVDNSTVLKPGEKRDSLRITTQATWNSGLFIADFAEMPWGCSIWPAYWSVGPNWPTGGEIDVFEGVHNQPTNQYTLHTSEGCTASIGNVKISSHPGQTTQCATIGGDNTGCAYIDSDTTSYGQGFNDAGGGVFAHLVDDTGITAWHFPRDKIPDNIKSGTPDPSNWLEPSAFWSSATCNTAQHFHDHSLVIDTTLCGDWAGATYRSAGCPGTCEEAVADPKNFQHARWKINYIAVYQSA
ncbi:putative glycosidase C21B10.07 [Leucoagaricus sp. SymC.cos]|nr:putative glycosidase C21B10.07 [Leucoagaricus sp. SymC.cos]